VRPLGRLVISSDQRQEFHMSRWELAINGPSRGLLLRGESATCIISFTGCRLNGEFSFDRMAVTPLKCVPCLPRVLVAEII
jgi:hypothetical protein